MSFKGVRAILLANSAVTDLVGQQVYSLKAANGITDSYIVLFSGGSEPVNTMHEVSAMKFNEVIVQCVATTLTLANAIADACRIALEHYKGTSDGVVIDHITYQGDNPDAYDEDLQKAIVESVYNVTVRY